MHSSSKSSRSKKPKDRSGIFLNEVPIKTAGIASALLVAAAGLAFLLSRKSDGTDGSRISDAPSWTLRKRPKGQKGALIGRSLTINRPRDEIYEEWRDFTRFPRFMDNVCAVEKLDEQLSRWTIAAPAGATVELVTQITHDVPGERIAWRSTKESQIATSGEVLFEDAPLDRGTVVRLVLVYKPPIGLAGKAIAKLFQREPNIQARRDLRRFKQLMETGEVTVNASPSARSSEKPSQARI